MFKGFYLPSLHSVSLCDEVLDPNLTFAEITINNPSGRYRLLEESESLYAYKLALVVHDVQPEDLGNYTCSARNSYGTVQGTIQLESMSFDF